MRFNRLCEGDAVKFIKELNVEAYAGELLGKWRQLVQKLDGVIDSIIGRLHLLIPNAMIERLRQIQQGIRDLRDAAESMIPEALKEINRRLKLVQKHIYSGEWHEIPESLTTATRETEARIVEKEADGSKVKQWEVHGAPFPKDTMSDFHAVDGWPDLTAPKWLDKQGNSIPVASFSGPIRPVKIPAGTKIRRVVTKTSNKAGTSWTYELAKDGKSWREDCAVLDSWSHNGYYIELIVPPPGIWAWEGKIASQIEGDVAKATAGQFLRGGAMQLHIDFEFPANLTAEHAVQRLPLKPTGWTDHVGINIPEKTATVKKLGINEIAPKKAPIVAGAAQRALRSRKRKAQQKTEASP